MDSGVLYKSLGAHGVQGSGEDICVYKKKKKEIEPNPSVGNKAVVYPTAISGVQKRNEKRGLNIRMRIPLVICRRLKMGSSKGRAGL